MEPPSFDRLALRAAEPDDVPFLRRVYAATRAEELARLTWTPDQRAAFLRQQFDAQDHHYRTHYDGAEYLVVTRNGAPIGRLYVARWPNEIRVMDIALLPEYRGAGIGARLLADILAEADAAGKRVSAHVERYNPAMRLYARLGFRPSADRGVYLFLERAPGGHTDADASWLRELDQPGVPGTSASIQVNTAS